MDRAGPRLAAMDRLRDLKDWTERRIYEMSGDAAEEALAHGDPGFAHGGATYTAREICDRWDTFVNDLLDGRTP